MNETGTSSRDTAALFIISSPGMIRNWKLKFEVGGYDALVSKKKGASIYEKRDKKKQRNQHQLKDLLRPYSIPWYDCNPIYFHVCCLL